MSTVALTSKGQVTVPKAIRDYLGIGAGDRITFYRDAQGRIYVEPATDDVTELDGLLHQPGRRARSVEEMHEAVADLHRRDDKRVKPGNDSSS